MVRRNWQMTPHSPNCKTCSKSLVTTATIEAISSHDLDGLLPPHRQGLRVNGSVQFCIPTLLLYRSTTSSRAGHCRLRAECSEEETSSWLGGSSEAA
mmetsp:Transcript_89038/g.177141  ORF Transcript_89038/g.177141 Transcript_89038/m.177141 type:complete len:97 (-) Transcript_89038:398-688(-)